MRRAFQPFLAGLAEIATARRLAPRAFRYRWAIIGIAVLALFGVSQLTKNLGNEFLPQVDDGNASVFVGMPPGVSAEVAAGATDQLQIARLKKRKLKLKDQITLVEDYLIPDIIA